MPLISANLFGKFSVYHSENRLNGLDACKVQELFAYLLIYRNRPHPRETLASLLWGDCLTALSKKYLRQALWQLQAALGTQIESLDTKVLIVEPEWIRLNLEADLWLDVEAFEQAAALAQGIEGCQLDGKRAQLLSQAVELYQGDLLEGWYQDWCLYERERLQGMCLVLLDKLMDYCEAHQEFENGLIYGTRILSFDRARERTHRRLMRLKYLAGDRTGALRQYDRCVAALREELNVKPAKSTMLLCAQIQADHLDGTSTAPAGAAKGSETTISHLSDMLVRLKYLQSALAEIQHQVQLGIQAVEQISLGPQNNRTMAEPRRFAQNKS